ncbi:tetratricopeptide repeat protein [Litorivivens sp.]|uniref:tetratricopeptide repeat protein n=1 Tax=Litorivivens sp. TaxID=2020868 RepID=UPI0035692A35
MRALLVILPLLLCAACAVSPLPLPPPAYDADQLLARRTIGLDPRPYRDEKYWLNPDMVMRHFVDFSTEYTDPEQIPFTLLKSLREEWPARKYRRDANFSAADAFHEQQANCLSYSAMVVSLMRHAGVRARFQRVEAAPEWDLEGSSVVAALHINAVIFLQGKQVEVDWLPRRNPSDYERRFILSDDQALAEWHNNLGAEALLNDDLPLAFAELSRALRLSPDAAHIWVNLGVIYRRLRLDDYAESAWLIAIEHDNRQLQAMSNLQRLYAGRGEQDLAGDLNSLILHYRKKNPYYYYLLAQQAESESRYDDALRHIQRARRMHEDLRFDSLLARLYERLNEPSS